MLTWACVAGGLVLLGYVLTARSDKPALRLVLLIDAAARFVAALRR